MFPRFKVACIEKARWMLQLAEDRFTLAVNNARMSSADGRLSKNEL